MTDHISIAEYNQSWRVEPKKKKRKPSRELEHFEQVRLFTWVKAQVKRTPELALLFAIPNGGQRHPAVAAKLKAEGVKPGVPDLCLPVARGKFHGLFIELKAPGGKAADSQKWWLNALGHQGYCAHLCIGWESARKVIEAYLDERLSYSGIFLDEE